MGIVGAPYSRFFVQTGTAGYNFPSVITPRELLTLGLFYHYAGIVDYEGYTCKFKSFMLNAYQAPSFDAPENTWVFLETIESGPMPEQGDWIASAICDLSGCYVLGALNNRLYLPLDYITASSRVYYGWDYWDPVLIPSWISIPPRGSQPQQRVYVLSFWLEWELYYNGSKVYTASDVSNFIWQVIVNPLPLYPHMVIDGINSYFPTEIDHKQPFTSAAKIVIENSNPNAEGRAYLDQVYKGNRTQLMLTQRFAGVASFEYSLAGQTIENILGQAFTKETFISSAELKFITGYIDDSGSKQQTNEWPRGINVTVSGGNGPPPPPPSPIGEKSLWETIKMPAMIGAGVAGLVMLIRRR